MAGGSGLTLLGTAEVAIPTPSTNKQTIFFDSDTGVPSYKKDDGTVLPLGTQGTPGIDGLDGGQGPQGIPGVAGATGATGAGEPGIDGLDGAQGPQGAAGAQGIQGIQGDVGAVGAVGASGIDGLDGAQGIQGIPGDAGAAGAQGSQGEPGIDGVDGTQGPQGIQGDSGIPGINGLDGIDGNSSGIAMTMRLEEIPANQSFTGITVLLTYGESLVPGDAVYFNAAGTVNKADADSETTAPCIGLAMETASSGSHVVLLNGIYRDDALYAWTVGGKVYLSTTAGGLTQAQPSGVDDVVQLVGIALHADRIYFNPDLTYVTHT